MVSSEAAHVAAPKAAPKARRARRPLSRYQAIVWGSRLVIILAALSAWQWLNRIQSLRHWSPIFDPFVVSTPSRAAKELYYLATGSHHVASMWPFVANTAKATAIGVVGGTLIGGFVGLILSDTRTLSVILKPFIIALNAAPRIAFIPIIVILFGTTTTSTIVTCLTIVIFIVFFNAFEGGRSIPPVVLQNARLLGASRRSVLFRIRLPYVIAWVFAAAPNVVSFGLVSVVTAEILTGAPGIGYLLTSALYAADATTTFALIIVLTIIGLILVGLTSLLRGRVLHWWDKEFEIE